MLRKFTGSATLLIGIAVLMTGFYAPAHSTIYFQYLTLLDNVQAMTQAFVNEPTGAAQRIVQGATATLAARFNWDTEQIAKFVPVVVAGCANDSLACYAQCEERLGSEKVWAEQQRQIGAHHEELAQLQWPGQGEIIVSGSSTLFPLTEHMATCYAYPNCAFKWRAWVRTAISISFAPAPKIYTMLVIKSRWTNFVRMVAPI